MHTLFILFDAPGATLGGAARADLTGFLAKVPALIEARIMTPDTTGADQPFAADGAGPALALQLYFPSLADAEAALDAGGALAGLAQLPALEPLRKGSVRHQVMEVRTFDPGAGAPSDPCCTFLVTYPGTTDDREAWLAHYDRNHPPIMKRFPRIREVETCWPVDWRSEAPFAQDAALQRNKVVFDSFADLIAALASPVMSEMRADGKTFPPFTGKATHFPMVTHRVAPA